MKLHALQPSSISSKKQLPAGAGGRVNCCPRLYLSWLLLWLFTCCCYFYFYLSTTYAFSHQTSASFTSHRPHRTEVGEVNWNADKSSSSSSQERSFPPLKSGLRKRETFEELAHLATERRLNQRQLVAPFGEPLTELLFTNQTGAVLTCAASTDLARSILHAERSQSAAHLTPTIPQPLPLSGRAIRELIPDLQVRWLRPDTGEELEDIAQEQPSGSAEQSGVATPIGRNLRWIRAHDGALVFEPFKPSEFRAEVHEGTYRCVASSRARGASLAGNSVQVRAILSGNSLSGPQQQQQLPEVLDELVLAGNSALFRCQLPAHIRDHVGVVEWVEYPSERVISFGSSTAIQAARLFTSGYPTTTLNEAPTSAHMESDLSSNLSVGPSYFVAPHTGDLHIVNVDTTFNYRAYKCRCKNKLTGELLNSANKGKLIVTEAHTPLAPRLVAESTARPPVHEEGELAILSCNVQSYPRALFTWYKRQPSMDMSAPMMSSGNSGEQQLELVRDVNQRVVQVANLLLINKVQQNDSGTYLCHARTSAGEERLEMELLIKAPLRVKLSASAHVLELGKSLALDCTVSGFPIQQVLFRHNQNLIKSITVPHSPLTATSSLQQLHKLTSAGTSSLLRGKAAQPDYFVVDEGDTSGSISSTVLPMSAGGEQQEQQQQVTGNNNKLSHVIVIVLEPQHAGAYQCIAQNQYESVQSSAYIKVLDDPPKFKETFKSSVFERGQDVSLRCIARANPIPEITWSIDEQPIPESSRTHFGDFVTKDHLVISYVNISGAQVADGGIYRCRANNGLAQITHQAQISVAGPPLVKSMANLTVVASTSFRIRCPVAGYPISEIQWLHQGKRLPINHRQHVYENGTLEVEHMERAQNDHGTYTCLAHQPGSLPGQGSLEVSIKARPTIEPFSVSRSLREGQRASITCTISSGDLPISIQWLHNEHLLLLAGDLQAHQLASSSQQQAAVTSGGSSSQQMVSSAAYELPGVRVSRASDYSSTLLFESLLVEHSGNYTCLAQNDAGSVTYHTPMVVQVAPKWSLEPNDTNVVRGSSSSIDCMASGFPTPRIIWTKAATSTATSPGGENLQQQVATSSLGSSAAAATKSQHLGSWRSIVSSPHLQVFENGSLNLLDARDNHAGYYMCQVSNGVGPGLSKVIRVTINVAAQFNSRQAVQYVDRNEEAQLKCQAKGDAPIQIYWFKNRHRLEPIVGRSVPLSGPNELVGGAGQSSGVLLVGSGSGTGGTQASLAQLQASALRQGSSVLEQLMALLGHISPSSSSPSSVQAGSSGGSEQRGGGSSGGHLQPAGAEREAERLRSALLMDTYRLTSSEVLLAREHSQQVSSSSLTTAETSPQLVQVSSSLSIIRADRQDTATFKCFAANQFGVDERTIQLVVQEPPERVDELSVLEVNSRSLTLAWLAPFDGNSPISNYHVQYRPLSGPTPAPSASPIGSSPDWLNFTLSAAALLPQQHTGGSPANNSTGQALSSSPLGRTLVRANVGALRPQTQYWFRVSAENRLGRGPVSGAIESVTLEEAPGAAPGKVRAIPQSSSSILVSWTRPSEKEIFGSLHGYYVAYKALHPSGRDEEAQLKEAASASPIPASNLSSLSEQQQPAATSIYKTIAHHDKLAKFDALLTGLKRSTRYSISVQAFNARGTGPATEPIQVRTLEMDPPRQVRLFVRQASNCSIHLEWRPLSAQAVALIQQANQHRQTPQTKTLGSSSSPTEQQVSLATGAGMQHTGQGASLPASDPVDYYSLYQAELNERPQFSEIRLPGNSLSHSVEGLKCGHRYQFYMLGVNKVGAGEQSDILETKTAGGLPLAPDRQSTFDVLNTTCYLVRLDHWLDNGCPITHFNVRYRLDSPRSGGSLEPWIQLAHFSVPLVNSNEQAANANQQNSQGNLVESNQQKSAVALKQQQQQRSNGNNGYSPDYLMDSLWQPQSQPRPQATSVSRTKRQVLGSSEQIDEYSSGTGMLNSLLTASSGETSEDSFLDYPSLADYSLTGPVSPDQITTDSLSNLSSQLQQQQIGSSLPGKQQLFSLLKDSMLPTFELDNPSQIDWSSPKHSPLVAADQQQDAQQSNSEQILPSRDHQVPSMYLSSHSTSDWRKVRLCNLTENTYYVIQISAGNSVGETEAELRIFTSPEGLEYDHEIKRYVIGRLDGSRSRSAQPIAMSDRLSLFALSQWPVLVPILLTFTLMFVIVAAALLLKRSNASARSNSTTTTTTTTTGAQGSCTGDFMHSNKHLHHHLNSEQQNGLNGLISSYVSGSVEQATLTANQHHQSIYQQRTNNHHPFIEEHPYGLLNHLLPAPTSGNETNRSSGSPATITNTISAQSNSNSNQSNHSGTTNNTSVFTPNTTLYVPSSASRQQQPSMSAEISGSAATLGRLASRGNVYLYTAGTKEEPANMNLAKSEARLFYGMTSSPHQKPLQCQNEGAHQMLQVHHHFQPENSLFIEDNEAKNTDNNYLQAAYQAPQVSSEIHGQMKQQGANSSAAPSDCKQQQQQMDNCFLTIVEEVARANDSLNPQQATNLVNQTKAVAESHLSAAAAAPISQCQPDCLNHLFSNGTSYAASIAANMEAQNQQQQQQQLNCSKQQQQVMEQNGQIASRPMFDPVYATIRRTFPQAFRYLTLQQNQHHQQPSQLQQQQQHSQKVESNLWNQRHSFGEANDIILPQVSQQTGATYSLNGDGNLQEVSFSNTLRS